MSSKILLGQLRDRKAERFPSEEGSPCLSDASLLELLGTLLGFESFSDC